jgi:hypothetical protein
VLIEKLQLVCTIRFGMHDLLLECTVGYISKFSALNSPLFLLFYAIADCPE